MHETALMKNLLDIVDRAARDNGSPRVRRVHLRIGEMAGVNAEAMRFAFEVLSPGTAAEGAELACEKVPLRIRCRRCGAEQRPVDFAFACRSCGASDIDILAGREMEVDYIETDDGGAPDTGAEPER